jgi:hypothetical protein
LPAVLFAKPPRCAYGKADTTKACLQLALRATAGDKARDCGAVGAFSDPKVANRCVLKAIKNHEPFVVRYQESGIDSEVMNGAAGDGRGKIVLAISDSVGLVEEGHYDDPQFVIVDDCKKPVHPGVAQSLKKRIPFRCMEKPMR